ncbi:MAG: tetratricopeptide repeat protein [Sumerlaeia bacterium]
MAIDIETIRKLVALDESDPVPRFSLAQKLLEEDGSPEAIAEAETHLHFVIGASPDHIAAYYLRAQVLERQGETDAAKIILRQGMERAALAPEGSGQDLLPEMEDLMEELEAQD